MPDSMTWLTSMSMVITACGFAQSRKRLENGPPGRVRVGFRVPRVGSQSRRAANSLRRLAVTQRQQRVSRGQLRRVLHERPVFVHPAAVRALPLLQRLEQVLAPV